MSGQAYEKQKNEPAGDFDFFLYAKNELDLLFFLRYDTSKNPVI